MIKRFFATLPLDAVYYAQLFLPMDLQNHSTTSRLLMAGVVLTFIIALSFSWPLLRKVMPDAINNNQPMEVVPERTPAEIISLYQGELSTIVSALESPNITVIDADKALNKFFFSARVPDAARTAHLKAALEFQNTNVKKTDPEKLTAWKEIIKKLQTAVAAV